MNNWQQKLKKKSLTKYFLQIFLLGLLAVILFIVFIEIDERILFARQLNNYYWPFWTASILTILSGLIFIKNNLFLKLISIFASFLAAFFLLIFYFLIMSRIENYTYNKCWDAIIAKDEKLSFEVGKNGIYKFSFQIRDCQKKLGPFPFFKTPQISDNPPGFK